MIHESRPLVRRFGDSATTRSMNRGTSRSSARSPGEQRPLLSVRDTAPVTQAYMQWGRTVINGAAVLLEDEIPGARCGKPSSLRDYEAVYVHFQDAHVPQSLAVWLYATREGAPYNVRGGKDVIAVGLKHDTDVELERTAWKFRRLGLFTWRKHVDERWEGFRWVCKAPDLPADSQAASHEVATRVLAALRRAGAVPQSP